MEMARRIKRSEKLAAVAEAVKILRRSTDDKITVGKIVERSARALGVAKGTMVGFVSVQMTEAEREMTGCPPKQKQRR